MIFSARLVRRPAQEAGRPLPRPLPRAPSTTWTMILRGWRTPRRAPPTTTLPTSRALASTTSTPSSTAARRRASQRASLRRQRRPITALISAPCPQIPPLAAPPAPAPQSLPRPRAPRPAGSPSSRPRPSRTTGTRCLRGSTRRRRPPRRRRWRAAGRGTALGARTEAGALAAELPLARTKRRRAPGPTRPAARSPRTASTTTPS